jgi:hypothetical protein
MEDKFLELNRKVKNLILSNTGVDINIDSRRRNIVELRGLYFTIIRSIDKKQSLQYLGSTVNRDHASVLHNLKKYSTHEKYNPMLRPLRYKITSLFTIDDEKEDDQDTYLKQIDFLKKINSKLIDRLNDKTEEELAKKEGYEVINNLNQLLLDTKGTELHDLMILRLKSIYSMNSKLK